MWEIHTDEFGRAKQLSTLDVVGQLARKSKVDYLQLFIVDQHQVLRLHAIQ